MLPVHSEFRRLHVGAHPNAVLQVRNVVLALRSSPTVLRGHLQMVALGGTREALCRPVLSGLLMRRIPCCLDETKPEGSITVGGGDAIGEPWTLAGDARISEHADKLAGIFGAENLYTTGPVPSLPSLRRNT